MVKIKEWTDDEVERLRELYTSNRTFEEIVEKFPLRSENAIRLKASKLGIKRPYIGNVTQLKPLSFKTGKRGGKTGYILKCKDCGSWMQVNEVPQKDSNVISCGKCGSLYQVLADL